MPLTDSDKERIRYHLGYPNVQGTILSFGIPVSKQTLFLLESSMERIIEDAIPRVLQYLTNMDNIEKCMAEICCDATVESVGNIKLRPSRKGESKQDVLMRAYRFWGGRLADIFSVPFYPYSERYKRGINIAVYG